MKKFIFGHWIPRAGLLSFVLLFASCAQEAEPVPAMEPEDMETRAIAPDLITNINIVNENNVLFPQPYQNVLFRVDFTKDASVTNTNQITVSWASDKNDIELVTPRNMSFNGNTGSYWADIQFSQPGVHVLTVSLSVQGDNRTYSKSETVFFTGTGNLISNMRIINRSTNIPYPVPGQDITIFLEYDRATGITGNQISIAWSSDKNDLSNIVQRNQGVNGNRISDQFTMQFGQRYVHELTAAITIQGDPRSPYRVTQTLFEMPPLIPGVLSLDTNYPLSDAFPPKLFVQLSGLSGGYPNEPIGIRWEYKSSGSSNWNSTNIIYSYYETIFPELSNPGNTDLTWDVRMVAITNGPTTTEYTNTLTVTVKPWSPGTIVITNPNFRVGERIFDSHQVQFAVPYTSGWSYKPRTGPTWTTLPAGQTLVINTPGTYDVKRWVTLTNTGQTKETNTLIVTVVR